jgi:hypothetical protein
MAKGPADFSGEIDTLYQVPLSEFIAARNALAARVKGEQGAEAAAAIKALQKPSIPAWVVNQLYWRDRREFERLTAAGDHLRLAQQQRLAGHGDPDDLRQAIAARQEVIARLVSRAREIMRSGGLNASPDMQQRVATTIESLSAYGTSDAAPRAGRLVEEVAPPGLDALAALIPAGGLITPAAPPASSKPAPKAKADLRVVERPAADAAKAAARAEKAEAASTALAEAEQAVEEARAMSARATAAQQEADTAWTSAHEALQKARRTLDEAMDREREAQHARDAARREATQAAHALERAERARDAAERQYQAHRGS